MIEQILFFLFSWKFIFTVLIIINIWILFTIKQEKTWIFRNLSKKDVNLIMKSIKNMNSREFELFIAYLFQLKGYKTKVTPITVDMGRDIIVSTDNGDIFIECKHYGDNVFVGRPIIQKLLGSMAMFKAIKGIIINTGQYHKNAIEASKMVNNLELWDIDNIIEMIKQIDSTEILKYLDYDRDVWEGKEIKN